MSSANSTLLKSVRNKRNLDGSIFLARYTEAFRGTVQSPQHLQELLTFAVIFLNSDDAALNQLGYRTILQYSELTGDLEPLRDVAAAKDYIPVLQLVSDRLPALLESGIIANLLAASAENYRVEANGKRTYRTKGQMELRAFALMPGSRVVVAPTSYGKSELLVDRVRADLNQATCIIVPTKALIAQTRRSLISDSVIRSSNTRIFTHPDSYNGAKNYIAVLTQERFFRLLQSDRGVAPDRLLIDEGHNMLSGDERNTLLSQVLLSALHRNPRLESVFYTPFIADGGSLEHVNYSMDLVASKVREHVKVEKLYYTDLARGRLYLYDQFLKRSFVMPTAIDSDEYQTVLSLAGEKNILYVNRPRQAEEAAKKLASNLAPVTSTAVTDAASAIADLIHPSYSLVESLRKGVVFHHGKVPDQIRQYVEALFSDRSNGAPRFLATTSTLLEGVNTPADRMFMLSQSRGKGHLTRSAFKNLIGRVGRFSEVFDPDRGAVSQLQPKIYILDGSFSRANFSPINFLDHNADILVEAHDVIENPLLVGSSDDSGRQRLLESLENFERGASRLENVRRVTTETGEICFRNGVRDFDIFENETLIQSRVDAHRGTQSIVQEPGVLVHTLVELFLAGIELPKASDLARLVENEQARNFYAMFVEWRCKRLPYRLMVSNFLRYWDSIPNDLVYVGTAWGDRTYGDGGFLKAWVQMSEKSLPERVNLAVAKVKEEQDFVDFRIMRYVEVMNDLELLSEDLYSRLKYGTTDALEISLIRMGASNDLTSVLSARYRHLLTLDAEGSSVTVDETLPSAMKTRGENEVLVYEARTTL